MKNNMKRKRSGLVISLILFLFSAVSLIYGIYMVRYSLGYVDTYTGMSAVPSDKVIQYVVSASSTYFGFCILFAACGFIILSLSSISHHDETAEDIDAHPENNPYYTAAPAAEPSVEPSSDTDDHENRIWQEAELHQVASLDETASVQHNEPVGTDHPVRPDLASDSWLKDAFIKK